MEDLTAYAAFGGLVWTLMQLVKYVDAKQWTSVRNQGLTWLFGILVTLLAAQTSFAAGIPTIGGATLHQASFWDQVFVGLTVAGVAGTLFSFKRAVDETDSDATTTVIYDK